MLTNSLNNSACQTPVDIIYICIKDDTNLRVLLLYAALNLLLLPLYVLVLYVGFQQWRQQGTLSATGTSDVLTYNLALVEIIGSLAAFLYTAGSWATSIPAVSSSFCLLAMCFVGQSLFHCEICVDRYLAVVHPITYRNLREATAVCIRNVSIVLAWIFVFSWIVPTLVLFPVFPAIHLLVFTGIFIVIVLYCCLSSLYVLIRPGPNGKKRVDQSKLKAFHIISAITCLLFFRFIGFLVYLCLYILAPLKPNQLCVTLVVTVILTIPFNAVIPLLFLRRMKKLTCC